MVPRPFMHGNPLLFNGPSRRAWKGTKHERYFEESLQNKARRQAEYDLLLHERTVSTAASGGFGGSDPEVDKTTSQ